MVSKSASKPPHPSCSSSSSSSADKQRFKGVRMRSWGKWVSEIRLPNTRARLWLGSFSTAEQAARAFDVAVVCLRGRSVALNFPNSPPTFAPLGLPHHQIQELAAAAAAAAPSDPSSSCELTVTTNSDESDASTTSCSSHSDESEAATTNEMSNSSCSSPSSDDSATFAGLLEESEQTSPLEAALQELALSTESEWDELKLMWGFPMTGYSAAWEEPLLQFPPFPLEDDADLPTIVEPSLWNL